MNTKLKCDLEVSSIVNDLIHKNNTTCYSTSEEKVVYTRALATSQYSELQQTTEVNN